MLGDDDHGGAGLLVYAELPAGRYYEVSYDRAPKSYGFRALKSGRGRLEGRTRSDHDGTGDACDRCTADFAREQVCLDAGFDPATGLSAAVVGLCGGVRVEVPQELPQPVSELP